jgi:hypothetical protein
MKILRVVTLISKGDFSQSDEWQSIRAGMLEAVTAVDWPPGSGYFTIYPESGKKRGEGNGVKPIKNEAILRLSAQGWKPEFPWPVGEREKSENRDRPGKMDACFLSSAGLIGFEWETGNISSSHRALNKMCLGLVLGATVGGILVVPSRKLYVWLTDRIGNVSELEPYFPLWASTPCSQGVLEVVVIEHDAESIEVPRIPKGTDGRAAG